MTTDNDLKIEVKSMGDKWRFIEDELSELRLQGKELLDKINLLKDESDITFRLYLVMATYKCDQVEAKLKYFEILNLPRDEFFNIIFNNQIEGQLLWLR